MAPIGLEHRGIRCKKKINGVPYVYWFTGVLLNAVIIAPGCEIQIIAELNRDISACVKGATL